MLLAQGSLSAILLDQDCLLPARHLLALPSAAIEHKWLMAIARENLLNDKEKEKERAKEHDGGEEDGGGGT